MAKFDDFELDLKINVDKNNTVKPNLTSVALCTPGCGETVYTCIQNCAGVTYFTC
ncbi:gallidermin/nisin family lantibiotic [Clostridium sp. JS66]|uniref:gallidermin/nisin family lantibiotic n=1 Tax=Clostridium sp. JS66 TaxID=3064705 RepID=UPI00298DC076|nr:gallidermin/nisin family lantibiotic [Clostridium sp. JS66]WPC43327.1 gallidermin/nisin family lantibiotic [Clostridium sp. JS66]